VASSTAMIVSVRSASEATHLSCAATLSSALTSIALTVSS